EAASLGSALAADGRRLFPSDRDHLRPRDETRVGGVLYRVDPRVQRPLMLRLLAVPLAALSFHAVVQPLSPPVRKLLVGNGWHQGCPVGLSDLRVLTVTHWGFDGRTH